MRLCVVVLSLFLAAHGWAASLRVSPLFGDFACVQAGRPVAVWGWNEPGTKVSLRLGDSSAEAVTDQRGRWQAELGPLKAGGPYTLSVTSGEQSVESKNILAGEVWLASGQSNMFWPLERAEGAESDIAAAANDQIRLFRLEVVPSFEQTQEPRGKWEVCSPETVRQFSGVAYYFGRDLQKELKVPVGIIQSALGGTPIEGWLPPETWTENADFERMRKVQEELADEHARKTADRLLKGWQRAGSKPDKKPPEADLTAVDQNDPSVCYNVGIVPLVPCTLAGFLWYQGEWNTSRAADYDKLLTKLVVTWRRLWGGAELPFYVVQLPGVGDKPAREPVEAKSGWAALRERQAAVLKLPNTGLAVTMDVGGELHPAKKRQVGERLSKIALARRYGRDVVSSGPGLVKAEPMGDKLVLTFNSAEGLELRPAGGRTGFAVAGDDKTYHAAEAVIEGDKIVLSSPAVKEPKYARYLWAQNPSVTVFNAAGLPAGPFRTDSWDDFSVAPYEAFAK